VQMSAIFAGVGDLRREFAAAGARRRAGQGTLLFVDEVHRFNKSQQDAFLPHVEDGTVFFIGATTENPSFELNNALLSRVRTYVLKPLTAEDVRGVIDRALADDERGLASRGVEMGEAERDRLAQAADGDARRALLLLEIVGGDAGPVTEAVAPEHLPVRRQVRLRERRLQQLMGVAIDTAEVDSALTRLDFELAERSICTEEGVCWTIEAPTHRFDIERAGANLQARTRTRQPHDRTVGNEHVIDAEILEQVSRESLRRFDKGGDYFYDQISALHKAVRGSSPDAALYWFCRMIDGGCDPLYIARRVVRIASEDIGNADPRALQIALDAWSTYERLGSPEGELTIGQAIVYMACAAKSNAVYTAFNQAMSDARESGSAEVPMHLRNAPTKLMKEVGHGEGYRYAHDEPDGFAAGATYFPDEMGERVYYEPVERGLEARIAERLRQLRERNRNG